MNIFVYSSIVPFNMAVQLDMRELLFIIKKTGTGDMNCGTSYSSHDKSNSTSRTHQSSGGIPC